MHIDIKLLKYQSLLALLGCAITEDEKDKIKNIKNQLIAMRDLYQELFDMSLSQDSMNPSMKDLEDIKKERG